MLKIHELPVNLSIAYKVMYRYSDACCKKHGITAYQFVLLILLAEEDGITQQMIVERAYSDPNTISAMLKLLEKKGMVKRDKHLTDGRKHKITITQKGHNAYKKALRDSEIVRKRVYSSFNADELKMLIMFLNRIVESLESSDILSHYRP
jgi:DNA-binding MarR family transcriptional regulator